MTSTSPFSTRAALEERTHQVATGLQDGRVVGGGRSRTTRAGGRGRRRGVSPEVSLMSAISRANASAGRPWASSMSAAASWASRSQRQAVGQPQGGLRIGHLGHARQQGCLRTSRPRLGVAGRRVQELVELRHCGVEVAGGHRVIRCCVPGVRAGVLVDADRLGASADAVGQQLPATTGRGTPSPPPCSGSPATAVPVDRQSPRSRWGTAWMPRAWAICGSASTFTRASRYAPAAAFASSSSAADSSAALARGEFSSSTMGNLTDCASNASKPAVSTSVT